MQTNKSQSIKTHWYMAE